MTPRRTQQPAQQHHPSHRKPSLPTQLAQNKQPGREQDLDRHATQDPLSRQLSPAQPDKQRRHRVNRLQHIKIPTKSHTSLTLTGEPCRNLVVVIVIETFENIPQQQTTFPKPRRHAPAVVILNSGGTPLPVEWNQNGRNTPPPLKYIERKGAKHSRKFDASTKTKFLSYASITTSIKHSRKFDASTKTKFLSYASITTSTKHSKNTIKGGTTQTTPSTHNSKRRHTAPDQSTHNSKRRHTAPDQSTHNSKRRHTAPDQSTHNSKRRHTAPDQSTQSSKRRHTAADQSTYSS
ncbi:uncharacterized protein LOC143921238 isoform X1 [Arctopsyche grandis]|uniref:uncharacterized protein LOC143921238 isoform X1 n=1 Tax=Arctopsyche grandis TaxID=121162 RepID=UPI00406DA4BE